MLSNNEVGLQKLYNAYVTDNKKEQVKSGLDPKDCERMVIRDVNLEVTKKQVKAAYAMSKQTVVNETDIA